MLVIVGVVVNLVLINVVFAEVAGPVVEVSVVAVLDHFTLSHSFY